MAELAEPHGEAQGDRGVKVEELTHLIYAAAALGVPHQVLHGRPLPLVDLHRGAVFRLEVGPLATAGQVDIPRACGLELCTEHRGALGLAQRRRVEGRRMTDRPRHAVDEFVQVERLAGAASKRAAWLRALTSSRASTAAGAWAVNMITGIGRPRVCIHAAPSQDWP